MTFRKARETKKPLLKAVFLFSNERSNIPRQQKRPIAKPLAKTAVNVFSSVYKNGAEILLSTLYAAT